MSLNVLVLVVLGSKGLELKADLQKLLNPPDNALAAIVFDQLCLERPMSWRL